MFLFGHDPRLNKLLLHLGYLDLRLNNHDRLRKDVLSFPPEPSVTPLVLLTTSSLAGFIIRVYRAPFAIGFFHHIHKRIAGDCKLLPTHTSPPTTHHPRQRGIAASRGRQQRSRTPTHTGSSGYTATANGPEIVQKPVHSTERHLQDQARSVAAVQVRRGRQEDA